MKKRVTYCNEQDLRKMDEIIDDLGGVTQGTNMRGDITVVLPKSPRTNSPQYTTTYDEICEAIESDNKKNQRLNYIIDNKEASCVNDGNKCCKSCNVKPKFYDSRSPSGNRKSSKAENTSSPVRSSIRSRNLKHISKVPQSDYDEKSGAKHLTSDARSTKAIIPKGEDSSCKIEANHRRSFGLAGDVRNNKTVEQKSDENVYKRRDSIAACDSRCANTANEENTRSLCEDNYMTKRSSNYFGGDSRFTKAVEPSYQENDRNPGCLTDDLRSINMVEPLCEENCCLRKNIPYCETNERTKVAETICEENCIPSKNSTCLASDMRSIKTTEKICEENYNPNRSTTCAVGDMRTMKAVEPSYDAHCHPRIAGYTPQAVFELEFDENGKRRPIDSSDLTRNSRYTSYKNNEEELKMKKLCSKFRNYQSVDEVNSRGSELDGKSEKTRQSLFTPNDNLNTSPCPNAATNQSKHKRKNISKRSQIEGIDYKKIDINAKTQLKLLKLTRQANDRVLEETLYLKDIHSDTSLESIIMNVNIEALQHKKALSDIVDLVRESSLPQNDREVYYFQTDNSKIKCHSEDERSFANNRSCRSSSKREMINVDDNSPLYKCPSGKKAAHIVVDSHPPPCVLKNLSYQKHVKEISIPKERESSPEESYEKFKQESSSKNVQPKRSQSKHSYTSKDGHPTAKDGHSTTKDRHPTTKDGHPTTKDGHHTLKDGRPTSKDGHHTLKDGRPTSKDGHPRITGLHHTKFRDSSKKQSSTCRKKQPINSKKMQPPKQEDKSSDRDSDALTERSERSKVSRRRYSKNVAEPFEIPPENDHGYLSEDNDRRSHRSKIKGQRHDNKYYDTDDLTDHSNRSRSSRRKHSPGHKTSSDSDRSGRHKKSKNNEDVITRIRTEDDDGKCFENRIYILLPGSKRNDKLLNSNQDSCPKCKCGHSSDTGASEYSSSNTGRSRSSGKPRRKVERFHHMVHAIPDIKLNEIQNYLSDPKNFAQATFGVPREVTAPRTVKQCPTKLKSVFQAESIKLGDVCDAKERPKTPKLPSRAEVEQLEMKVKGILTNSGGTADSMAKNFNHEIKIPDDLWPHPSVKSPNHSRAIKNSTKSPTRTPTKSPIQNRIKSPPKTPGMSPIRNPPIRIQPPIFSSSSSSDEYNAKPSLMFGNKVPKFSKPIKHELCQIQNTLNEIPTKIPVSIRNHSLARIRTLSQPRRPIKPLPLPKHDSRSTPTLRAGRDMPPSDRIMCLSRPKPNMKRV